MQEHRRFDPKSTADRAWQRARLSATATRTTSPVFSLIQKLSTLPQARPPISLALGDPTSNPQFRCPDHLVKALKENADSAKHNGYQKPPGSNDARSAIATRFAVPCHAITFEDVFIASSCSAAIDIVVAILANEGDNILIPEPGWSHYNTMFQSRGIEARCYPLLSEKDWQADLERLPALIDNRTVALLVNNPSNPCGSVYSRQHLLDLLSVAEKHHLPVLADEIYCDLVFPPHEFIPMASLAQNVPLISFGGMSKSFMVPGWRVGWAILYDRFDVLADVRGAMFRMGSLLLGANSLAQSTISPALFDTPAEYFAKNANLLAEHGTFLFSKLQNVPGLKPYASQGTFYMMVGLHTERFRDIQDDLEFTAKLSLEEGVLVMPVLSKRQIFIRLTICPPREQLEVACARIAEFCNRHSKSQDGI